MKTKIQVSEIFKLQDRFIFIVEIIEGDHYLIGDVFENESHNLKFELKGIGMENQPQSTSKSLVVVPQGDYENIDNFKGKTFEN